MTKDEFERILTSLRHTNGMHIVGAGFMVPFRAVVEIVHSNLHPEDKEQYVFDWATNTVRRKHESS